VEPVRHHRKWVKRQHKNSPAVRACGPIGKRDTGHRAAGRPRRIAGAADRPAVQGPVDHDAAPIVMGLGPVPQACHSAPASPADSRFLAANLDGLGLNYKNTAMGSIDGLHTAYPGQVSSSSRRSSSETSTAAAYTRKTATV